MARSQSLLSPEPSNIVSQPVTIGHIQLRDLIICPDERGIVNFVHDQCIMERDISDPSSTSTPLVVLNFVPNTLASLHIPDSNERLVAAGGQDAELHLSIHTRRPHTHTHTHTHLRSTPTRSSAYAHAHARSPSRSAADPDPGTLDPPRARTRRLWQYDNTLSGSINNSVLLTSLSLTRSHESSAEPRVAVSNNDCTIKFYDVNVRGSKGVDGPPKRITEAGTLRLDVPVNHSSISPDGRTLLSVGDSPHVYLHGLTGGARITFAPLAKLALPPPAGARASAVPAAFSTAFSACGTKFAVASQEGMVAVWDVRSHKPMKVFYTDRSRCAGDAGGGGEGGGIGIGRGWSYDDAWDWSRTGRSAPGWGVRNVKFSPAGPGGREVMTFTEHTSLLHVVDATTFEAEEIVRVPTIINDRLSPASASSSASTSSSSPPHPRAPTPNTASVPPAPWDRAPSPASAFAAPPPPAPVPARYAVSLAYAARLGLAPRSPRRRWETQAPAAGMGPGMGAHVVVVPALGDRVAEREVRRVLGRHGLRAALSASSASASSGSQRREERDDDMRDVGDYARDDEREREEDEDEDDEDADADADGDPDVDMDDADVRERDPEHEGDDELDAEPDCLTSRAGSPAPPPSAPSHAPWHPRAPHGPSPASGRPTAPNPTSPSPSPTAPTPSFSFSSSSFLAAAALRGTHGRAPQPRTRTRARIDAPPHLDLAGTCFDPSGRYLYVASTSGIVEWAVRGAEKQWRVGGAWA